MSAPRRTYGPTYGLPGMTATDLRKWAKEEIIDAIDAMIKQKTEEHDLDDKEDDSALRAERDRVAKFLGFGPQSSRAFSVRACVGDLAAQPSFYCPVRGDNGLESANAGARADACVCPHRQDR